MLEQGAVLETSVIENAVIAVTMATSRQGTGVVKELSKTNKYQIRAITRNLNSLKAVELGKLKNVELVKGDLMDPESLNRAFDGVDVIFGNTTPTGYVPPSQNYFHIERQRTDGGGVYACDNTNFNNTTDMMISGHYIV